MGRIHPTAIISPAASISDDAEIGPWCIVDSDTKIGPNCTLLNNVSIGPGTVLGSGNRLFGGVTIHSAHIGDDNSIPDSCVLGSAPLVRATTANQGRLEIGSLNMIREFSTIQREPSEVGLTRIGDCNFRMPDSQVGHDRLLSNHSTIANFTAISGHVTIEDCATLGLGVNIHQYCGIGCR